MEKTLQLPKASVAIRGWHFFFTLLSIKTTVMSFKLKEYNLLQIHQKAVVVCSQSILLDMELQDHIIYTLYGYSGYYIEVQVDDLTKRLINIVAFKDGERLDKYLEKLDLHELI